MATLKAPLQDVQRLVQTLSDDFDVQPLLDATRDEFDRSARRLLREAKSDDRILFYYSGHGVRTGDGRLWLTTGNFDPNGDPYEGGVRSGDICEWAREGLAGQLVLIFDCCFAAVAGGRAAGPVVVAGDDFPRRKEGRGTHILMASDRDQVAPTGDEAPPDGRASHFTDLLIRGLEGDAAPGERQVTIARLSDFLRTQGEKELGVTPVIDVEEGRGDFPLVRVPDPGMTLVPRRVRMAVRSPRLVERAGAATFLGRILQNRESPDAGQAARLLLEEVRDAADADDELRQIASSALEGVPTGRLNALRQQLEEARHDADSARDELQVATEQVFAAARAREMAEGRMRALVQERDEKTAHLRDTQHELALLAQDQSRLTGLLEATRAQVVDTRRRLAEAEKAAVNGTTSAEELERLRNLLAEARASEAAAAEAASAAVAERDQALAHYHDARAGKDQSDSSLAHLVKQLAAQESATAEAERRAREAERAVEEAQRRAARVDAEIVEVRQKIVSVEKDAASLREAQAVVRAQRDKMETALAAANVAREQADNDAAQTRDRIHDLTNELAAAKGAFQAAALRAAVTERESAERLARIVVLEKQGVHAPDRRSGLRKRLELAGVLTVVAVLFVAAVVERSWRREFEQQALEDAMAAGTQANLLRDQVSKLQIALAAATAKPAAPAAVKPQPVASLRLIPVDVDSHHFLLAEAPVTVELFRGFAQSPFGQAINWSGCRTAGAGNKAADPTLSWQDPGFSQDPSHPVVCVSHDDAEKFVDYINGATASTQNPHKFRLPTLEERELLVKRRWASGTDLPKLDDRCALGNIRDASLAHALAENPRPAPALVPTLVNRPDTFAKCDDGYAFTAPVETQRFGTLQCIRGLYGNVAEWTEATNTTRAWMTGVSWASPPFDPTGSNVVQFSGDLTVNYRGNFIGFRLASDP